MDSRDREACADFGVRYWNRFDSFRTFEGVCLSHTGDFTIANEAWNLLPDLERAYAAKAYTACFTLACAMIEIHLSKVAAPNSKQQSLRTMLEREGLLDELRWLVKLRNDIMHGNSNEFVKYYRKPELEAELEAKCFDAFRALHTIAARVPDRRAQQIAAGDI